MALGKLGKKRWQPQAASREQPQRGVCFQIDLEQLNRHEGHGPWFRLGSGDRLASRWNRVLGQQTIIPSHGAPGNLSTRPDGLLLHYYLKVSA